ncbi:MAG: putative AlkP superfamily pyrophosphatase or phosphodiesterase [Psychromonas sp.]|jgi:predicted AlkP superfamily pyrophosphatase or phosphodiesterase
MKNILLWSLVGLLSFSSTAQEKPYVLLISFDGFRHDYVSRFNTPNFDDFIKEGTAAQSLRPSFPSKTFPNHYTLVTGLYPGNHGLVGNQFYDKSRKAEYGIRNRSSVQDAYFYGGMPLWQLTQENGYKSASYFWVGSEAAIKGRFPDYYYLYDGQVDNYERVDQCIKWLNIPIAKRPRFISLYFSLVDSQGHKTGPNSPELENTVEEADKILGYIMENLKSINLPVNIIITSDHGMTEVNTMDWIDSKPIIAQIPEDAVVVSDRILSQIYLDKSQIGRTYTALKALENNFKTYRKKDMPKSWHYSKNDRVGDVLLVAEPGYAFRDMAEPEKLTGEHGYDPYLTPEMGGIFYANGPNIKKKGQLGTIQNIDVYPLVTKILGFKNPKIDGKFRRVKGFYRK